MATHALKYFRSKDTPILISKGRYLSYVTKMRADVI